MKATKLTKERIQRLKPPASGYAIYRDETRPGFGLRITASGARSFMYEARANGRNRRITIGRFPTLSVEAAWNKAKKHAATIADGKDPVIEGQRAAGQRVTLKKALEGYLESRDLKPGTVEDIRHAMKGLDDWMGRRVVALTPAMIEERHRKLGEKSHARANLTMRYLRAILNYAASKYADDEGRPLIAYNPVKRLSATKAWYRVERRRNVIREHELGTWWGAVEQMGDDPKFFHGREYRDYLVTLLLTGLRRSEALNLTWRDVDFVSRALTVTDTKNRETHTLPLPGYLLDLLKGRHEQAAEERKQRLAHNPGRREPDLSDAYVFTAKDGERIANFRTVTAYVEQKTAEALTKETKTKQPGLHVTLHDLRRTFATIAERLDIPAYALKRLLNHKQSADVTAGYIVADVERLRAPMDKIADFVLKAAQQRRVEPIKHLRSAS